MSNYDWNAFDADRDKASELMGKIDPLCVGYSRMVIVLACARTIAVMFGPARNDTREYFLNRFPNYMRSMWRLMDEVIPRGSNEH